MRTDPTSLRRILENLIGNAVTYAGGASLRFERADHRWEIQVVDTGPGMSEALLERVFEPFERGEASRSRSTGGAGLGLTIAKNLARQIGCDVVLTSILGTGTVAAVRSTELVRSIESRDHP